MMKAKVCYLMPGDAGDMIASKMAFKYKFNLLTNQFHNRPGSVFFPFKS